MNMKKLVALLLALVMVFALCACGSKDNQDTDKIGRASCRERV